MKIRIKNMFMVCIAVKINTDEERIPLKDGTESDAWTRRYPTIHLDREHNVEELCNLIKASIVERCGLDGVEYVSVESIIIDGDKMEVFGQMGVSGVEHPNLWQRWSMRYSCAVIEVNDA